MSGCAGVSAVPAGRIRAMSKAFTKESDYDPTAELVIRPLPVLPSGAKNYITPTGAEALEAQLHELREELRPKLLEELADRVEAGTQEDKEHKMLQARLQKLEERIRHLEERISTLEIVPHRSDPEGPVRFGDCVVAEDRDGREHVYTIVGVDEADVASGRISWISPLGKAFLGAEEGDEVVVRRPRGEIVMDVLEVRPGTAP